MLMRDVILYETLVGIVGEGNVSRDEMDRRAYARDQSWLARTWALKGWDFPLPDIIVWAESTDQVSAVLRAANRFNVPVVPYCGGAGVQGGTLPLYGGIILDTKKMDEVLALDEHNLTVTTQTGIMYQNLEWWLNQRGYTLPHLPQSSFCSGIGGFLSARSAGVLSTKYGKISSMVRGMEVVLPDGQVLRTKAVPQSAAGPDLNYLFQGAEGTLGVITEATLSIWPLPEERRFRGFTFPDLHSGMEAARLIMRRGLRPAAMRLSDELETMLFHHQMGCLMVWCFDGFAEMVDLEEGEAIRICQDQGGTDLGAGPGEHWWKTRYSVAYPTKDSILAGYGPAYPVGTIIDTAGGFDYLEQVHEAMGKAVGKYENTVFLAHFSHWYPTGGMMYPYVYKLGSDFDETMADQYFAIQRDAVRVILDLGGTINHHHGIGLTLAEFMRQEFGDVGFAVLQGIKRLLDPNNVMNPGKLGFEGR